MAPLVTQSVKKPPATREICLQVQETIHRAAITEASLIFFWDLLKKKKMLSSLSALHILECSSPTPCPWFDLSTFLSSQLKCHFLRIFWDSPLYLGFSASPIVIVHPWITFTSFTMPIIYYYKLTCLFLIYFQSPTSHQKLNERRAKPVSLPHCLLST